MELQNFHLMFSSGNTQGSYTLEKFAELQKGKFSYIQDFYQDSFVKILSHQRISSPC